MNTTTHKLKVDSINPRTRWLAIVYRRAGQCTGCLFIILLLLAVAPACTSDHSEPSPVVTICATTGSAEACPDDQTEFVTGQRLSAYLVAGQPLAAQQIIGRILRLSGTDTIPLGVRVISLKADQRSVVQDLPFHEFGQQAAGNFLIEFRNDQNQLVAKKEITITGN